MSKYGNALTELTLSEKPVSGLYDSKDLATAFNKAHEAFEYLCEVDQEFRAFEELFNREQARASMAMLNAEEKADLEQKLTHLLILLCPYLSKPKTLFIMDWLMRKYFIHAEYVEQFLQAVLPHHTEKFAMKLIQHLDWRFVDLKEWGWIKDFAVKGVSISNEAFARACVSSESGFLHRFLWNALKFLGQDEQRLSPYIQLYVTTMSYILTLSLGKSRWAKQLQPALELIERGLKRKACPCFASGVRIVMMKAARTMPLNPDLVQHWISRLLRAAKKPVSSSAYEGASTKAVETILLVKTLCLAQNITLSDKSQSIYNSLVEGCTEEQRDFLRNIERSSITPKVSAPGEEQDPSTVNHVDTTLLHDLSASSGRDSVDSKQSSSILEKVKQIKRKKKEVAKKVKSEELQNIFMNEHEYTLEQIENVLVRCLSTQSGLEWSMTRGLTELLAKVLKQYNCLQENPEESVVAIRERHSDSDEERESPKDDQERQLRSLVTLINQVLLCLLSLCQTQAAPVKDESSTNSQNGDHPPPPVAAMTLDVEPIFHCLTKVKELEVHRLVMQVVTELAKLMPWTLVHHMMSVVTSMSHEVLPLADESSLHLVSQLVSVAIPAYVKACSAESQGETVTTSASVPLSVLGNFISVWDTVPSHRRYLFYRQLVHSLSKTCALFNSGSQFSDKSHFLWTIIVLFECELMAYPAEGNKRERLLNFLVSLMEEYPYLQQIATLTRVYEFLSFLTDDTAAEKNETACEQPHLVLWKELKKVIQLKLRITSRASPGQGTKRRRVTAEHSASVVELSKDGVELDLSPALIGVTAALHQKLIAHHSKDFVSMSTLKSSKKHQKSTENNEMPHHPASAVSIQLSLELKELVNHIMNLWQLSQAQPELGEWRSAANALHQLLCKLSVHLPLSTYLNVLLSIVGSQKASSVLGRPLSASFIQNWPRLRSKAFELLLSALRSGQTVEHNDPTGQSVKEVYLNCLVRLQDIWVTTKDDDAISIQMRCYCLLSTKELIKLLLENAPEADGLEKSSVKAFIEVAKHLCRYLTSKTSAPEATTAETHTPNSTVKERPSKRRSTSSGEPQLLEESTQEEFSLVQVVVAGLLPHLHKPLLPNVSDLLLASHSVIVHPDAGDLVLVGSSLSKPEVLLRWTDQRWHRVLAALQLLSSVSTAHPSLLTEMMEEWQRGKLVPSLTTVFRMALLLQTLWRKGESPALKDSCAVIARQCLSQLQLIRDAIAKSGNCVEFLLELFKTRDYAVTRGALSIATVHCRHLLREASGRRSETSWDSDTHFLYMADMALDACDMCVSASANDMEVDQEEEDDETVERAVEDPLWSEVERFLVTLLLLPDADDLEERVTLLQRLVTSSEKHTNHVLRMKMLLGVITKYLPHTTPEFAEELVGRVGLNTLVDQGS